jgi:hypothetical protein
MQKKVKGIFLTELNFLRFIFNIFFLNKKYCVLDTYSYLFNHGGYLKNIVNKLHKKQFLEIIDDHSNEIPYLDTGDCKRLTDVFAVSEDWMNEMFNMQKKGYYGNSIRHIISSRTYNLYERCIDLFHLSKIVSKPRLNRLYKSFFLFRYNIGTKKNHYESITTYFLNFFLLLISYAHFLYWLVSHIKIFYIRENYRFAADYLGGSRDIKFWNYLNPKKEKTLIVVRDEYTKNQFGYLINDYKVVYDDDGVFGFYLAIKYFFIFIKDSLTLYIENINIPPDYFRQICFLPYKKIKYKAFFNKFNCKFFWGRDDYNYQHIIRSQELRKNGGVSIGCNHGIESINSLSHILRQLDFDYYYTHGIFQYLNTYKKYWPKNMVVKGIGSFFSNPYQHQKIKESVGKNVAIIIAPSFHQDLIFKTVLKLSSSFPNLIFWISTKDKHRHQSGDFSLEYQNLLKANKNIKENTKDVYDLIRDCKYIFSESSTLLAEAVYFEKVALCYDPEPKKFKYLYYRNFPELVFNDVDEVILRITETQNKSESYYEDRNLIELISKTKDHPWNIIKKDMMLIENI